jgi:glycosidase
MTYLGAPMVYYGTEAGMWGADDPDDRKPMVWPDLTYDVERSHPVAGKSRRVDDVKFDRDLHDYYRKLIGIRNSSVALRRGSFKTLKVDDAGSVYAFERVAESERVVVVINASEERQALEVESNDKLEDRVTGRIHPSINGKVKLVLEETSGMVLVRSEKEE